MSRLKGFLKRFITMVMISSVVLTDNSIISLASNSHYEILENVLEESLDEVNK